MKKIKFPLIAFMALMALSAMLVGCNDDLQGNARLDDGYIHLKFLFNNNSDSKWDDSKPAAGPSTRSFDAQQMESTAKLGTPLYLHCEESMIADEPAPLTRGERLTGEVFNSDGGINSFGLYVNVGGQNVYDSKIERSSLTGADTDEWKMLDADLAFPGEDGWPKEQTGDFYGFAPHTDEAANIAVAPDGSGVPVISFTMQEDETANKDILMAATTGVEYAAKYDVQMQFRHILSALKFKLDAADAMTTSIEGTDYHIQMKSMRIEGIYSKGSCPIAATTAWTRDAANTTGHCEITAADMRQRSDILGDTYLNTDEHCLMVLPQTVPDGGRLVITCDLTENEDGTGDKVSDVSYYASLKGLTWEPGHSYTYKFSRYAEAVDYVFSSPDFTTFLDNEDYTAMGGYRTFHLTSQKAKSATDGTSSATGEDWHLEYSDDGGTTWKTGLPGTYYLTTVDDELIPDLGHIPGGDNVGYRLYGTMRVDGSATVQTLQTRHYAAAGNDYLDLSTNTIEKGAVTPRTRSTANCYVIDGWGKFKLPLVYGNAILDGNTNTDAYTEIASTRTGLTYEVFDNYKDVHIAQPYILDDTGVSLNDVKARIEWMDQANLINLNSLTILKEDHGYIAFEIDEENVKPGNMVVSVLDGDGIVMWSWHIWVTHLPVMLSDAYQDDFNSNNFAIGRHNLGYREREDVNNVGVKTFDIRAIQNKTEKRIEKCTVTQQEGSTRINASNLYYQFGRKDPVPAIYKNESGSTVKMETDIKKLGYTYVIGEDGVRATMAEAIRNPAHYYNTSRAGYTSGNYHWMIPHGKSSSTIYTTLGEYTYFYGCALWNPNWTNSSPGYFTPIKTVYDPSPYGYVVATPAARDWAGNHSTTVTSPTIPSNEIYMYTYTGGLTTPLTGERNITSGVAANINVHGYAWTSYISYSATYSSIYNTFVFGPYYSSGQNRITVQKTTLVAGRGLPVRPMRDRMALGL